MTDEIEFVGQTGEDVDVGGPRPCLLRRIGTLRPWALGPGAAKSNLEDLGLVGDNLKLQPPLPEKYEQSSWMKQLHSDKCSLTITMVEYEMSCCWLLRGILHSKLGVASGNEELERRAPLVLPWNETFLVDESKLSDNKDHPWSKVSVPRYNKKNVGTRSIYIGNVYRWLFQDKQRQLLRRCFAGTAETPQNTKIRSSLVRCLRPRLWAAIHGDKSIEEKGEDGEDGDTPNELNADVLNEWMRLLQIKADSNKDGPKILLLTTDYFTVLCRAPDESLTSTPTKKRAAGDRLESSPKRSTDGTAPSVEHSSPQCSVDSSFVKSNVARVQQFLIKKSIDIFSYDRILFPVNFLTAHWVLIVVDIRKRTIALCDPLRNSYLSMSARRNRGKCRWRVFFSPGVTPLGTPLVLADIDAATIPDKFDKGDSDESRNLDENMAPLAGWLLFEFAEILIKGEWQRTKSEKFDASSWKRVNISDFPNQAADSHDCGVLVGQYARLLCRWNPVPDFTSSEIDFLRCFMAACVLMGDIAIDDDTKWEHST